MKTMIVCLTLAPLLCWAQIDQDRMERDLEVAENILETVLQQGENQFVFFRNDSRIEASYRDGYGVIFRLTPQHMEFVIAKEARLVMEKEKMEQGDAEVDFISEEGAEDIISVVKDYLIDYGDLIHQLKSTDKIMVRSSRSTDKREVYVWLQKHGKGKSSTASDFQVELLVADLQAYNDGKIDREEILSRIEVQEEELDLVKEPDLEVFASTLDRIFQSDLSRTYYLARTPVYDRMKGYGITYYLKFYSSRIYDDNLYSLPTIGKKDLSETERNKIVESMYPDFLQDLKSALLDYGHMLRSIEDDELVNLQIELTSCRGCDMPEEIEVTFKKSLVEDYRKGSITMEKAAEEIKVMDLD
jgi:hypothetical protein